MPLSASSTRIVTGRCNERDTHRAGERQREREKERQRETERGRWRYNKGNAIDIRSFFSVLC